jgi:hypothetical protein
MLTAIDPKILAKVFNFNSLFRAAGHLRLALLESIRFFKLAKYSLISYCILYRFEWGLIRKSLNFKKNEEDENYHLLVYIGNVFSFVNDSCSSSEVRLYAIQVTIFTFLNALIKYWLMTNDIRHQAHLTQLTDFLMTHFAYCLCEFFQTSLLLALNDNCCSIVVLDLVANTHLDYVLKALGDKELI